MAGEETWIQTAEKITLFRNQGRGAEAARLLEISPTNRIIIDRNQAIILMVNRVIQNRMTKLYPDDKFKYTWITGILDGVEEHQLTIDGKSREQFMKVAIAQYQGQNAKQKGEMESYLNK
jgi:hypothetical protein